MVSPNVRARFMPGPRGIWKDVPDALWNDWHWQQRERVTRLAQLEQVIRVTDDERRAALETESEFQMGITPYYAALMDPEDPSCPIRLQSVPKMEETFVSAVDLEDPLAEERDMPTPGITHRYRTASSSTRPTTARCTAATARASARWRTRRPPRRSGR